MNKTEIQESLSNHSDGSLKEMYNTINGNEKLKEKNKEFIEMLYNEIQRRKGTINNILDK